MSAEQEEVIINCVAIFYEEGKGGENFRKKTNFGVKSTRARSVLRDIFGEIVWQVKSHSNYKSIMKMNSKANPKAFLEGI